MLVQKLFTSALAVVSIPGLAVAALAGRDDGPLPEAFDGQYMTTPVPGPTNNATEWWYFQVVGESDPTTGIVPSFEAVFYLGFAFTLGPGDPRYQFDVSGVFPNGTTFFISAPVATFPTFVTNGQDISGNWGEAAFSLFEDSSSMVLAYNSSSAGVTGGVTFKRDKTSAHVPASPNTQGVPYFSALAQGQTLNSAETILYTESGWVIEMPRATAEVSLDIGGTEFKISGTGYHDHNWAPVDFGQITYTWVLGLGSCGPYDIGYFEVKAVDSTRDADIVQGSLAYNGEFLQTEAHRFGSKPTVNTVDFQLTGETVDPVTQQAVPTGVEVTYTIANGTVYQFNLTNSVTNPALPVYHRWRLVGTGGEVGGEQYQCALIGEWLNPGLAVYSEGGNIFADAYIVDTN